MIQKFNLSLLFELQQEPVQQISNFPAQIYNKIKPIL